MLISYCALDNAVISSAADIVDFDTLKAVADDIQARKDELGVEGAFTSAGLDGSSYWRFVTHLVNMPIYWEMEDKGVDELKELDGTQFCKHCKYRCYAHRKNMYAQPENACLK